VNALEVAIQAHWIGIRRKPPFRRAQQDGDMRRVDLHHARWNATGFHGFIDGGKNNVPVSRDVNNHAAPGEIGDNLVFGTLCLCGSPSAKAGACRKNCEAAGKPNGNAPMSVISHSTYIVRPDAVEPIPAIKKRKQVSTRIQY
jgi:hypothetical protein